MAFLPLGIFYGGVITGIPVVTGVAEGVSHQKKANEEAANETRMRKFYLDVYCEGDAAVDGSVVALADGKVWAVPKDPTTGLPQPTQPNQPPPHPFTGFYLPYPDDARSPPERGLVSTISDDPPMLNWIYAEGTTGELRYGNRTQSIRHRVGPWDWTEGDEQGLTLEGWEGFVVVDEGPRADGLRWAVYYDREDDGLRGVGVAGAGTGAGAGAGKRRRRVLRVSLERRLLPEELVKEKEREVEEKMQVKSSGDLKTKWG